jgi:crossover junction endodeoxyribonuclease RuvC
MLVIGVDPGTETTGYGIVQESQSGSLETVHYGVIKTEKNFSAAERLQLIYEKLTDTISLYGPTTGAVEKLFFQRNVTTAISVGQARGVILLALANAGLKIAEYTPSEVKLAVTGYGGADKKQIQLMVQAILNLKKIPKPDDAADALAIAICHIHSQGYLKRLEDTNL